MTTISTTSTLLGYPFSPMIKNILHGFDDIIRNPLETIRRPVPVRIEGLGFDQLDKIIIDLEKDLELLKKIRSEKLEKELGLAEEKLNRLKELKGDEE